jgi:hypothetical protein
MEAIRLRQVFTVVDHEERWTRAFHVSIRLHEGVAGVAAAVSFMDYPPHSSRQA